MYNIAAGCGFYIVGFPSQIEEVISDRVDASFRGRGSPSLLPNPSPSPPPCSIFDWTKWNSKPPSSEIKDKATRSPKERHIQHNYSHLSFEEDSESKISVCFVQDRCSRAIVQVKNGGM